MGDHTIPIEDRFIAPPLPQRRSKHWKARALRREFALRKRLIKQGVIRRISPYKPKPVAA